MTIIKSPSTDPEYNFSLERELLGRTGGRDFLLLYIDSPCVVIGRNQSPEAEADLEYCRLNDIPVLRRISGGGAVWHDLGNINYSFITSVNAASPLDDKPHAPIIAALASMGVEAVAGPRGELLVNGRKISGTASCVKRGRRLFHGTLLHAADLDAMQKALGGDPARRGHRVASVPAEVMNLNTLPDLDIPTAEFLDRLAASLCSPASELSEK